LQNQLRANTELVEKVKIDEALARREGERLRDIARSYGVSHSPISRLQRKEAAQRGIIGLPLTDGTAVLGAEKSHRHGIVPPNRMWMTVGQRRSQEVQFNGPNLTTRKGGPESQWGRLYRWS
jgi:hypothetical protein